MTDVYTNAAHSDTKTLCSLFNVASCAYRSETVDVYSVNVGSWYSKVSMGDDMHFSTWRKCSATAALIDIGQIVSKSFVFPAFYNKHQDKVVILL